jgi:hypothetical protein
MRFLRIDKLFLYKITIFGISEEWIQRISTPRLSAVLDLEKLIDENGLLMVSIPFSQTYTLPVD